MNKLEKYEIRIADVWEPVKGHTNGLRKGWLEWRDAEGCSGLARPGTWRKVEKTVKAK